MLGCCELFYTNMNEWNVLWCIQSNSLAATLLYNYTAVHAIPVTTNILTRTRLRMSDLSASVVSYVWPWPEPELFDRRKHAATMSMMLVIGIAIIMVVPTFASEIVRERRVWLLLLLVYGTHRCRLNRGNGDIRPSTFGLASLNTSMF